MRPPGGVSFADQSPNHSATSNFARQQHKNNGENGRQFVQHQHQQQQAKNGVKANGFGNNRQQPPAVVYGHGANDGHHQHGGVHHLLPNGRGGCDDVHQQRCGCCPYGFHIDLGFVKFAEDVAAGKEQIQNWSSPAKKRARRLLNSPSSSDRTLLDLSQTTERGGISNNNNNNNKNDDINANFSPPLNETSLLSKSVDEEDELPELLLHFQSSHRQTLPSSRARHPQHRYQQQHQQQSHNGAFPLQDDGHLNGMPPTSILKNAGGSWGGGVAHDGFGRATSEQRRHQTSGNQQRQQQLHNHQQQHQSRFYQQQQQQQPPGGGRSSLPGSSSAPTPPIGRRRFPLCMDAPTSSQLGGSTIGSPLRTSTPRMASEEMQHFFAASQQRPSPALRPSTASIGSRRDFFVPTTAAQQQFHGLHQQSADTGTSRSGTNSAPSSPVPRNFHTAIAQSMAQLRKTSSRGASGALSAIPVPQSSHLSALSAPARHVFSSTSSMATATTTLAHQQQQRVPSTVRPQRYLELGGVQRHRMLSPEPHQQLPMLEPPAGCSLLRRSNMQSRAFFHAANNGGGTSTPLAASGGGRVPYRSRLSATPSAWDLGDFASVRRHRLDACGGTDFAGGGGGRMSSSTPTSFPPSAQLIRSLSPPPSLLITSTIASSHRRTPPPPPANFAVPPSPPLVASNAVNGHPRQRHPFPIEASAVLRTIGTQTMAKPSRKEVAIGTDRPKSPPKRSVRERGTSPQGPPPSVAVPSASVGVDTRDLSPEFKNAPPLPPPKPSGPGLAVELQRRRDLEERRAKMGNLSAEFQYCLGHEPEHTPGEQPQFVGPSTEGEGTTTSKRRRSTIDCGVDAFCLGEEFGLAHSLSTSTTDLEQRPENNNNNDTGETMDAVVQTTEPPAVERSEKSVGTEPKGMRTAQVQTETEREQDAERHKTKKKTTEEQSSKWAAAPPAAAQTTSAEVGAQTDESEWLQAEIGRRLAEAATERREKRKRNRVERGTETEEKEAPDQFIMITCNKCEQRSSLASDELFEKIVVPPEDNDGDDAARDRLLLNHKHFERDTAQHCGGQTKEVTDACGEELLAGFVDEENVRGEMTTILEELEEGELCEERIEQEAKMDGEEEWSTTIAGGGGVAENVGGHIDECRAEHWHEDWKADSPQQEQQRHQSDLQQQQQQLSQNVSPLSSDEGLVLADGDDGEEDEEALEGQDEEALEGQHEEALEGQDKELAVLEGQDEEALEGQHEEALEGQDKELAVLEGQDEEALEGQDEEALEGQDEEALEGQDEEALEGQDEEALEGQDEEALEGQDEEALEGQDEEALEGQDEEELTALEGQADPMDMDRISLETDVQTVICAEEVTRPGSSVSFCSVDAKTTAAASRTEALRKMLTEPQRYAQAFQRDAGSNRSYRAEKGKANDLEYIIERHKSDALREAEPTTPSCPSSTGGGQKALKEAITLKKTMPHNVPAFAQQAFSVSNIPEPVPARIPRPKFAKYSPNAEHAETAAEEAEAADRLTPLRSEMRALASSLWGGGGGGGISASVSPSSSASGSPRVGRAALFLRTQNNGHVDEGEEDDDESAAVGGRRAEDGEGEGSASHSALVVMEDASSTSSEGARTYEMSEEESAEFELSAPLRDALETIDGHLARGATAATTAEGHSSPAETEWAYKYCQHEWMKLTTKKSANAELVEQFIDALEAYSSRLMQKVVNMTDQNGNTALHYAVSNENFDVVSVLLDSKVCRVDEMNKAGYSALMLAALCELRNETECAIVQRLFQMGNVNAKAVKHAQTALMLAASHGRVETTSLLLNCGADVNIQDVDGSTALMCAAEHGQREIVKILLKRPNIDASLTDCDNQTALSIAVENQHRDIGVLIYAHLNFSRLESNDQSVSI
uniref:Uncharacterized protein n=1 Tax=Globodera rostochiensis TaxID=31243 RepID=A0A914HBX7_GLORO